MAPQPVFRFAPSPNGALHLGHAYSALFTAQAAQAARGRFLLRIEDIDGARTREDHVENIYRDLAWLGLTWETPVRRQSHHAPDYRAALAKLEALGVLYPCYATRGDIAAVIRDLPDHPKDPDGSPLYPGLHRNLSEAERRQFAEAGRPAALRLDMARACEIAHGMSAAPLTFTEDGEGVAGACGLLPARPEIWGDVVLARKDINNSYHLAVVVDDALQRVSTVTRGQDLFFATHLHRLLQVLLGLPEPRYRHHRLIRDEAGEKLSKSAGDRSLASLREHGVTARQVRDHLAANPP